MPSYHQFTRIDTVELKLQIIKKLGRQKAEKYFYNLKRLLNLKLSKLEFDKLCHSTVGKENVALHNVFIRSILTNAFVGNGLPSNEAATGHSRNNKMPNRSSRDTVPIAPQRGRTANSKDRKSSNRPSPLGPLGKVHAGNLQEVTNSGDVQRSREQQSAPEFISIGSKALLSVEDGEEVEQVRGSPSVQSKSPLRAPLGVTINVGKLSRRSFQNGSAAGFNFSIPGITETCHRSSELPDMRSLKSRLEHKVQAEGLGLSVDFVNLLNNGLDAYLKSLIGPCLELARARCRNKNTNNGISTSFRGMNGVWQENHMQVSTQHYAASLLDFKVAMELNPRLLGGDWPTQLEKICLRSSEE